MKRSISFLLMAALLLSGLALAESFQTDGYPIVTEPVTLSMVISEGATSNTHSQMWKFAVLQEKTGVAIEVERVPTDIWDQRKPLMFASNELPDFFVGGLTEEEKTMYLQNGQLVVVNGLVENYMPDYAAFLSQYDAIERAKLYNANGEMVGFVSNGGDGWFTIPGARAIINKQWLANVGKEMPTNFEEFVDVLRAFRDEDVNGNGDPNDEYPLSGYSEYLVDAFVAMPLGVSVTWSQKSNWFERDGKMEYLYTDDLYRVYLERMRLLFMEQLLDNEYYTQTRAQMLAKGANTQVGACTFNAPFVLTGDDPEKFEQYTGMVPMGSEYSEGYHYANMLTTAGLFLTSANRMPEITARLINYFFTEEYGVINQGPEVGSKSYGDWDGKGGWHWLDNTQQAWTWDVPEGYNGSFEWLNMVIGPFQIRGSASQSGFFAKLSNSPGDTHLVNAFEEVKKHLTPGFPQSYSLTAEETDELALITNELNTYIKQMEAKFVIGELSIQDDFDQFQDTLKRMDVDRFIEIHQGAYARFQQTVANMK